MKNGVAWLAATLVLVGQCASPSVAVPMPKVVDLSGQVWINNKEPHTVQVGLYMRKLGYHWAHLWQAKVIVDRHTALRWGKRFSHPHHAPRFQDLESGAWVRVVGWPGNHDRLRARLIEIESGGGPVGIP